jgi:hypothetical protein
VISLAIAAFAFAGATAAFGWYRERTLARRSATVRQMESSVAQMKRQVGAFEAARSMEEAFASAKPVAPYDSEAVRGAFEAFRRHAQQLQESLSRLSADLDGYASASEKAEQRERSQHERTR